MDVVFHEKDGIIERKKQLICLKSVLNMECLRWRSICAITIWRNFQAYNFSLCCYKQHVVVLIKGYPRTSLNRETRMPDTGSALSVSIKEQKKQKCKSSGSNTYSATDGKEVNRLMSINWSEVKANCCVGCFYLIGSGRLIKNMKIKRQASIYWSAKFVIFPDLIWM